MNPKEILVNLCEANGPSGFEHAVSELAATYLKPYVDEVTIDHFGNVLGRRLCGKPGAKKVLLDAHLDEIGLMITGMTDGFLRFCTIGGVDPRMLPNCEVTVLTAPPMYGVISCLPPHIQNATEREKAAKIPDLYVDIGLSQAEAEKTVPIGTPMVFRSKTVALGEGQLQGKAMDDRACFVSILMALEQLNTPLDVDLYILGSAREEVGGAGAVAATFSVMPDCCVAIDVTHGKTPDAAAKDRTCKMGGGPAIGKGPNMTRWMTERLVDKAQDMPHQIEIMTGHTGTNAWPMQIIGEGIATAVLSLPLKYMHTPIETLCWQDVEYTAKLLVAFVKDLGQEGGFVV